MKKIRFGPGVRDEVRAIDQGNALRILQTIRRLAETGQGDIKPLSGEFESLMRLRAGNYRVPFDETEDTITVHRIRDRRDAYR